MKILTMDEAQKISGGASGAETICTMAVNGYYAGVGYVLGGAFGAAWGTAAGTFVSSQLCPMLS